MNNVSFLFTEGWKTGALWHPTHYPDIPPDQVMVRNGAGGDQSEHYIATSTRLLLLGREIGRDAPWGAVVSTDVRNPDKFAYTLPGGRVQPDFDGGRDDEQAEESVLACLSREVDEEVRLTEGEYEPFLIGIRRITERHSQEYSRMSGLICVDTLFVAITETRLGVCHTKNGETGDREVVSPLALLGNPREGSVARAMIPQAQKIALCAGLIALEEIVGNDLNQIDPGLRALVKHAQNAARAHFESSMWRPHTTLLVPGH